MGLFNFFKRKPKRLEDKSIVKYVMDEDKYTGLTRYYECRIANGNVVSTRILEKCPKDYEVLSSNTLNPIRNAIQKCNNRFSEKFERSSDFLQMETLYRLDNISTDQNVAENFDKYLNLKNRLLQKCKTNRVSINTNKQEIISEIINRIEDEFRRTTRERGFEVPPNIRFCKTKESINEELEKERKGKYNSQNFSNARLQITSYYARFIEQLPWLLHTMEKKRLAQPEKLFLSRFSEVMECLPELIELIDYIELCENNLYEEKQNNRIARFTSGFY